MPRDDLSIDFNKNTNIMPPPVEHQDAAATLDEFINRAANLPNEVAFMQEEITEKDRQMQECLRIIARNDNKIQKWIAENGTLIANPKEDQLRKVINENYDKAKILSDEKITLATKTQLIVDKHVRYLDGHIKALQDRGELSNDPDLPSLLKPQPQNPVVIARPEPSAAQMPLNTIANPPSIPHTRHPNQYPVRVPNAAAQARSTAQATHSAPTTPAAAMLSRQARESSLGAASKRQRLTGGLGPLPPSNLARHSSMTPGTPRGGTPSGGRAGSAGPRSSQKTVATKKAAPAGSRQSGVLRKAKPVKSGLSRLKRANKNSPSSTNDSELSDAESGTGDEDDEAVTPPGGRHGDGDEEMLDLDDDEGSDDKKYCMCQNVSFGDMVACDNDSCPYEWFHWSCVGLKSEPIGTWICPVCTKSMKK